MSGCFFHGNVCLLCVFCHDLDEADISVHFYLLLLLAGFIANEWLWASIRSFNTLKKSTRIWQQQAFYRVLCQFFKKTMFLFPFSGQKTYKMKRRKGLWWKIWTLCSHFKQRLHNNSWRWMKLAFFLYLSCCWFVEGWAIFNSCPTRGFMNSPQTDRCYCQ